MAEEYDLTPKNETDDLAENPELQRLNAFAADEIITQAQAVSSSEEGRVLVSEHQRSRMKDAVAESILPIINKMFSDIISDEDIPELDEDGADLIKSFAEPATPENVYEEYLNDVVAPQAVAQETGVVADELKDDENKEDAVAGEEGEEQENEEEEEQGDEENKEEEEEEEEEEEAEEQEKEKQEQEQGKKDQTSPQQEDQAPQEGQDDGKKQQAQTQEKVAKTKKTFQKKIGSIKNHGNRLVKSTQRRIRNLERTRQALQLTKGTLLLALRSAQATYYFFQFIIAIVFVIGFLLTLTIIFSEVGAPIMGFCNRAWSFASKTYKTAIKPMKEAIAGIDAKIQSLSAIIAKLSITVKKVQRMINGNIKKEKRKLLSQIQELSSQ